MPADVDVEALCDVVMEENPDQRRERQRDGSGSLIRGPATGLTRGGLACRYRGWTSLKAHWPGAVVPRSRDFDRLKWWPKHARRYSRVSSTDSDGQWAGLLAGSRSAPRKISPPALT